MILYHGTAALFHKFRPFSFFGETVPVAEAYARMKDCRPAYPARILQCYVQLGKVVQVHGRDFARVLDTEYLEDEATIRGLDWYEIDKMTRMLLRYHEADTLVFDGIKDIYQGTKSYSEQAVYKQYVVRSPEQVRILNEAVAEYHPDIGDISFIIP